VRIAANLAADQDAIIKHVLNGLGDRVATAVNPMAFGWDPALKPYKQDIARAKKLLEKPATPTAWISYSMRRLPPSSRAPNRPMTPSSPT
jgi:peptide/nickel transport system substrate-binding protein